MAEIVFDDPHVFNPGSDPVEDATVLRAHLLDRVAVNLEYLRRHSVPALYQSGVVYGRTIKWLSIPAIRKLTYADCKSLAPWRIAEMIHYKICKDPKPVFRFAYRPNGGGIKDFHVLIDTEKGLECPSRILGMGRQGPHNSRSLFAVGADLNRIYHRTNPQFSHVYW